MRMYCMNLCRMWKSHHTFDHDCQSLVGKNWKFGDRKEDQNMKKFD